MITNLFMYMLKEVSVKARPKFVILNGKIIEVKIKPVGNAKPLKSADMRNLHKFLINYSEQIVTDFFVLKKSVSFDRISKRLK